VRLRSPRRLDVAAGVVGRFPAGIAAATDALVCSVLAAARFYPFLQLGLACGARWSGPRSCCCSRCSRCPSRVSSPGCPIADAVGDCVRRPQARLAVFAGPPLRRPCPAFLSTRHQKISHDHCPPVRSEWGFHLCSYSHHGGLSLGRLRKAPSLLEYRRSGFVSFSSISFSLLRFCFSEMARTPRLFRSPFLTLLAIRFGVKGRFPEHSSGGLDTRYPRFLPHSANTPMRNG